MVWLGGGLGGTPEAEGGRRPTGASGGKVQAGCAGWATSAVSSAFLSRSMSR
jgi:hypothetical protein